MSKNSQQPVFLPTELNGRVPSVLPTDDVLAGGRCRHCKQRPCFSMRVFEQELIVMERDLVQEGKSPEAIRAALLERGYDRFCMCYPPEEKPKKLPLCFGMY